MGSKGRAEPDGPDSRKRVIKLLTELGGISATLVQGVAPVALDQPCEDSPTETEELILHLLDDLNDARDLGQR